MKKNYSDSKCLTECRSSPDVLNLVSKMKTLTSNENFEINDGMCTIDSLCECKKYLTLYRYCMASNSVFIDLNHNELYLLEKISNLIYSLRLTPHNCIEKYDTPNTARFLLFEILNFLNSKRTRKEIPFMQIYSCHDTTMLALARSLNLIIDAPSFGGYYLFELWKNKNNYELKFYYNRNPEFINMKNLKTIYWNLTKNKFIYSVDSYEGNFNWNNFLNRYDSECYINLVYCLIGKDKSSYSNNFVEELFKLFDHDDDGIISKSEFEDILSRWYIFSEFCNSKTKSILGHDITLKEFKALLV